jgi:hypothetical protein
MRSTGIHPEDEYTIEVFGVGTDQVHAPKRVESVDNSFVDGERASPHHPWNRVDRVKISSGKI